MIESWELPNRSKLIEYLREYRYDKFAIFDMYLSNELPKFIESEYDAQQLASEVLGITIGEDWATADEDD
jgi:hypothetical protein